jgi:hypothetical protein
MHIVPSNTCGTQERHFYVFNTGGLDMQLNWQLRRFVDAEPIAGNGLVEFDLRVEQGSVRAVLDACTEPAEGPFIVEPLAQVRWHFDALHAKLPFQALHPAALKLQDAGQRGGHLLYSMLAHRLV